MLSIATNSHGTRVLQALINYLNSDQKIQSFAIILRPCIVEILKDINANHIVHKFTSVTNNKYNSFVYQIIADNIVEIATNKNGCCVVQRLIDNATLSMQVK
jgi:hypothetical protein